MKLSTVERRLIETSTDSSATAHRIRTKSFTVITSCTRNVTHKALNSTAHLYLSNRQVPAHSKKWPRSIPLPPPQFKNVSLWLHSGKPAFIGTFMEYPFFLLIKRRKISQGVVAFPPSFICLLIILHICSCLHLFNALTECVCVCMQHHLTASAL